jgi:hypothetical protein
MKRRQNAAEREQVKSDRALGAVIGGGVLMLVGFATYFKTGEPGGLMVGATGGIIGAAMWEPFKRFEHNIYLYRQRAEGLYLPPLEDSDEWLERKYNERFPNGHEDLISNREEEVHDAV